MTGKRELRRLRRVQGRGIPVDLVIATVEAHGFTAHPKPGGRHPKLDVLDSAGRTVCVLTVPSTDNGHRIKRNWLAQVRRSIALGTQRIKAQNTLR